MPQDVVIIPSSGIINFSQTESGAAIAYIKLDSSSSDLSLTTTSGNLVIGDSSRDVYVGNGVANVDIVFEQDGEIRGLTNKTIVLGQTDSFIDFKTSRTTFSSGSIMMGLNAVPSGRLHIRDDTSNPTLILDDRGASTDPFIRFIPSNTAVSYAVGIDDSDADKFKISYGNNNTASLGTSDRFVIENNSGNIGIGASDPQYQITLSGRTTQGVFAIENGNNFVAKNSAGVYETYLWPRWTDNVTYLNYGSAGMQIRTSSSLNTMFMTSSTTVGIGTNAVTGKLHVRDDTSNVTLLLDNRGASTDPYIRFIPTETGPTFAVGIDDSDSDKFKISYAAGLTAALGTNDRLTIDSAGNIGIGTTNPSYKTDVAGDVRVSGNLYVTGNQKQLIVSTSGFPIGGSDYSCLKADGGNFTTSGTYAGFYFQDRLSVGAGWQWYSTNGVLKLYDHTTTANDRLFITKNGDASEWGINGTGTANITLTINSITSTDRAAIRIVNANEDTSTSSSGRVFYGWLPIQIGATRRWIQLYT